MTRDQLRSVRNDLNYDSKVSSVLKSLADKIGRRDCVMEAMQSTETLNLLEEVLRSGEMARVVAEAARKLADEKALAEAEDLESKAAKLRDEIGGAA